MQQTIEFQVKSHTKNEGTQPECKKCIFSQINFDNLTCNKVEKYYGAPFQVEHKVQCSALWINPTSW